jgi:hypothetical protein
MLSTNSTALHKTQVFYDFVLRKNFHIGYEHSVPQRVSWRVVELLEHEFY